jgi:nicotinamidase-related amidase
MSLKLYKFILSANVPVILASHDTSKVEGKWQDTGLPWKAPNDTLLEGTNAYKDGIVSWDKDEVMTFLRSHEVTDVYFTGVSYPGCVEARPIGLNNMKKRFNCHVVADCVLNTAGTGYTDFDILHETYVYLLKSGESHSFLSNVRN